eukprot:2452561-Ditylum_brightwellii.AAC.1
MNRGNQKQCFATWPGLIEELVRKHLPKAGATVRVRQTRIRQHICSTQKIQEDIDDPEIQDNLYPEKQDEKENIAYFSIINPRQLKHGKTGVIYSDIMGKFLYPSSQGHQYIMVLYDWDSHAIIGQPMKKRSKEEIVQGIQKLYEYLKSRGVKLKLHILDNEASNNLKYFITSESTEYQLALPRNHCTNATEKCIQIYQAGKHNS